MHIIQVADDFWNIRGSFKIGGVVDIGTHASLVRIEEGRFVFLDSLTLTEEVAAEVAALTDGGEAVEAILNLHPFHTVHVQAMHEAFPQAALYGTQRHLSRFKDLPWETLKTEDAALHERYADSFDFSIPAGVDFISSNPNLHFSSVLVMHKASATIHVDDTLMFSRLPGFVNSLGIKNPLLFHPTLSRTLEKRAGAASDFRQWGEGLIDAWGDAKNLCAAHTAPLLAAEVGNQSIADRIRNALKKVEKTLQRHERKYG